MNTLVKIALVVICMLSLSPATVAAQDAVPICATLVFGAGSGAPRVDLKLIADVQGVFAELAGEARFTQAVAPPAGLIVYAVNGAAIPNSDGTWFSLTGNGFDLARTIFRVNIAGQLSLDPTKNTVSYVRQNLDGTAPFVLTGTPLLTLCP